MIPGLDSYDSWSRLGRNRISFSCWSAQISKKKQLKKVKQCEQQAIRPYCPDIYFAIAAASWDAKFSSFPLPETGIHFLQLGHSQTTKVTWPSVLVSQSIL